MKDIDFDELDKAVNSLMGGLKGNKTDEPAPKMLTISSTLKEDEKPEYSNIDQAAKKIGNEAIISPLEKTAVLTPEILPDATSESEPNVIELPEIAVAEPEPVTTPVLETPAPSPVVASPSPAPASIIVPARRPSGRFMDVMHPSSDMKTSSAASPKAPPSPDVSHFGTTVSVPAVAPPPAETAVQPVEAPVVVEAPVPTVSEPAVPTLTESLAAELGAVDSPAEEPQSSPFLPDAKVEKRPLGGAPTEESASTDVSDELTASQSSAKDAQLAPDATVAAEIPEEYHDDLLAIETNLAVDTPEADDPLIASELETPTEETGAEAPVDSMSEESGQPTGPSSIAQQYKEQPSTGDQSSGAIYDTNDYHKPVNHPAKSAPGWLWVVAIIVIVIICGAGAAAFYLLSSK
jgi:hypothetical protein